ncbi:MAG: hypothetical protein HYX67_05000 [Candidatus Melainabacteria bacterium]|nr:hypothetical protein [Candidatus Melainabacteria bacterium]
MPPRYQWDNNSGYCGEVSLISAGLYYGQYNSQYDARTYAINKTPQNKGQLLLGKNDTTAAAKMHLKTTEYSGQTTQEFLAWVKQNVVKGYPVAIGIYTNEYIFYSDTNPDAGDPEYDHIVPVKGIVSNHPISDPNYYPDDILYFNDNGLYGDPSNPQYTFRYTFQEFQATREQANAPTGNIYSVRDDGPNYGIAITGIMDLNNDTLPVQLATDVNFENPQIKDGTNTRPTPMTINLTVTVSNLEPNVPYVLYRYNQMASVPNSQFNAQASAAYEKWPFQISSGTTYTLTEKIQSDEVAVYRCVKATAP